MNDIGLKLKSLRKARHQTQQDVADRFGLSRTTISNYEIGRRRPTITELQSFAEYFGVSLDHFGVSTSKDELIDLVARAKKIFGDDNIEKVKKEAVYRELMKLYLDLEACR